MTHENYWNILVVNPLLVHVVLRSNGKKHVALHQSSDTQLNLILFQDQKNVSSSFFIQEICNLE